MPLLQWEVAPNWSKFKKLGKLVPKAVRFLRKMRRKKSKMNDPIDLFSINLNQKKTIF